MDKNTQTGMEIVALTFTLENHRHNCNNTAGKLEYLSSLAMRYLRNLEKLTKPPL